MRPQDGTGFWRVGEAHPAMHSALWVGEWNAGDGKKASGMWP
jgi:hypothetical protein